VVEHGGQPFGLGPKIGVQAEAEQVDRLTALTFSAV